MSFKTLKTHPDFQSLEANVQTAKTMYKYVGEALTYSYMFEKRTTPWEAQQWDYDALQEFKIDLEKVDRLYYIYHYDDNVSGRKFEMIARMEYEEAPLYVELSAGCDYTGFDCQGGGQIFVSRDANLFMKLVLAEEKDLNKNLIYKSLREDRIYVEEETDDYDKYTKMFYRNAPMLKYLCHQAIYEYKDSIYYKSLLPKILAESIDDFIKTKEAKIAYDGF